MPSAFINPAKPSEPFARVFAWYVRRLLGKRFNALRAARGTLGVLRAAQQRGGPCLVLMNHASWWDPLVGFHLHRLTAPADARGRLRAGLAPMEAAQLERFAFFRRLGVFGVDPDDAASLRSMGNYLEQAFAVEPRTTLWITPQGEFADVREEVRLRPGAAAIAARLNDVAVVCLAVEYGFWVDQRPEAFLRLEACPSPGAGASTSAWLRAMTQSMRRNGEELARLVIARDPAAFEPVLGAAPQGEPGRINPAYDLWLRLRGKGGAIQPVRRGQAAGPAGAGGRA